MKDIIYLDAAASALKPQSVIDCEMDFLTNHYANAGRGVCARSQYVDDMVNRVRGQVASFINASPEQIVFTSGTTDGMNRIVKILESSNFIRPETRVLVSDIDHHSARLPWEELAMRGGCTIDAWALDENFNLDIHENKRTNVLVLTAMSNVMGVPQDIKKITQSVRSQNPNAIIIVDAAQYVAHAPIDVTDWDVNFVCFSGHKIGADTGVGVMYVQYPEFFNPDKFGGGMIDKITDEGWRLSGGPHKFEAGTLPLTQIAGLGVAIDELIKRQSDHSCVQYLYDELSKIDRIKLLTARDASMVTMVVDGMHVLDFGALMGAHNICVRVGNMCATWIHQRLGIDGSIRLSPGPWNTMDEMKSVIDVIKKIVK
ncbi:aminotransferase class V-fold PLP-dependent enzyme [Lachnospiraceae bacterium OttesenSCG-928-E19]|nr:aminotransferase class V-fold PLP-dependent enzyme [Lachnospiraceae bacterium OttesenSCG-928-E19]